MELTVLRAPSTSQKMVGAVFTLAGFVFLTASIRSRFRYNINFNMVPINTIEKEFLNYKKLTVIDMVELIEEDSAFDAVAAFD